MTGPPDRRAGGPVTVIPAEVDTLPEAVGRQLADGARFLALVARADPGGSTTLQVLVGRSKQVVIVQSRLRPQQRRFPTLTTLTPAAAWYEREVHDLFGLVPEGHHRLQPLVLPRAAAVAAPRPGAGGGPNRLVPDTTPPSPDVVGEGLFTIPYGPVRSGIFETVEYLVETYGEDIPALRPRVHYKHRGLDWRFTDLDADDAVLLAERVEGVASVAHASAFCQALEALADVEVPRPAQLLRVVHAELERIANHLDSMLRHCEGAGQAVAYARLGTHKEQVQRLRAALCGHRFGRGVVVPGGVSGPPGCPLDDAMAAVSALERALRADVELLMATPSFLDRLRGTGRLDAELATSYGALGPVGRGSEAGPDVRLERPYGGYRALGFETVRVDAGDALGRQQVRVEEIRQGFHLVHQALDELDEDDPVADGRWRVPVASADGLTVGSVEAPQGELLYLVEVAGGRLVRVKPRCPSFHNLALFPAAFRGDILTDFVFIEASFGLSFAGVAG